MSGGAYDRDAAALAERFELVRRLGVGGMGIVHEAVDRASGQRVAVKTLKRLGPDSLRRFKREFRALQDIQHPNLVTLGELASIGATWFMTMELIDGVDLRTYCRGAATSTDDVSPTAPTAAALAAPPRDAMTEVPCEPARVRAALVQLVRALETLHAAGAVHRDVKPSNVRVTPAGRVVLLDFGLVTELSAGVQHSDVGPVGTTAYMAPEQAAGEPVGPAADLYAVGVCLYELLAGRLPFEGSYLSVLMDKQRVTPPPPSARAARVPEDLDALCEALLAFVPAERPDAAATLRALGAIITPATASMAPFTQTPPFVGRQPELAALADAAALARTTPVLVAVTGESGLGKSALVREFVEGSRDGVVLRARCYEREHVPFKGVDGVIDAIARFMRRLPETEAAALLPRGAGLLVRAFPVLGRVATFADAPAGTTQLDPQDSRTRMFAALRELLSRMADRYAVTIVIDDLQWADADSLALLADVVADAAAPPLLWIATVRGNDAAALPGKPHRVHVGRLAADDARRLAALLLERFGAANPALAVRIAAEADGHPLFIDALARHAARHGGDATDVRLEDAVAARIDELDAPSRALLHVVAVRGARIDQRAAAAAAGINVDGVARAVAQLRVANLILSAPGAEAPALEPYHDRVRDAAAAGVGDDDASAVHRRIAMALEQIGATDPDALAHEWAAAGETARAVGYARAAADRAAANLAFARAARLYDMTLELLPADAPERRDVLVALGDARANCGEGSAAAEAYLAGVPGASAAEALDLQRRAAVQLLQTGRLDEGLAALKRVLAGVDLSLPASPKRALMSLLWTRARIRLRGLDFAARDETLTAPHELMRIDVCWSAAVDLAMLDTIRGADFQARHLLLALRVGEPYRITRTLALETAYVATAGSSTRVRTQRLLDRARAAAALASHPNADAWVATAEGYAEFWVGHWARALERFDAAVQTMNQTCSGVWWELVNTMGFAMAALYMLGDIGEHLRRRAEMQRAAEARGDTYSTTRAYSSVNNATVLAEDDVQLARHYADLAARQWSGEAFLIQNMWDLQAQAQIDLYCGDAATAFARFETCWGRLARSLLLRVQYVRVTMWELRGRAALAHAQASGNKRARAVAKRAARVLARERVPWADALAATLRAGLLALDGRDADAVAAFDDAIRLCTGTDMGCYAAAAQWRRAELLGGDAGLRDVASARAWFGTRAVAEPDAFAALFVAQVQT